MAICDVNGDGKHDLVVATSGATANSISVLLGNGNGSFGAMTDYPTASTPFFVAVGELNGDGKPDLVVANYDSNTLSVLLGDGDGSFGAKTIYGTGFAPSSVAVDDLNGDGKPDVVTANGSGGANSISVLLGNGNGSFASKVDYSTDFSPTAVAMGDLNGDVKPDVVASNGTTVSVRLGTG